MSPTLAALFVLGSGSATYEATLVYQHSSDRWLFRPYATATVLTDAGTVAGYACDSVGVHGETSLAKPFVWSGGKLISLPLSGNDYGHVYAGNDALIVGSVDVDGEPRPAIWRPDKVLGWSKPKLHIHNNPGRAVGVRSDGAYWVHELRSSNSKTSDVVLHGAAASFRVTVENFVLTGVDRRNRLFGYRYERLGEGLMPRDRTPGFYLSSTWTALAKKGESGMVRAVNMDGVAVGELGSAAAVWNAAEPLRLATNSRFSSAESINDQGEVVGDFQMPSSEAHAFVWKKGKLSDLRNAVPGLTLSQGLLINNNGWIVAKSGHARDEAIYLLKPL